MNESNPVSPELERIAKLRSEIRMCLRKAGLTPRNEATSRDLDDMLEQVIASALALQVEKEKEPPDGSNTSRWIDPSELGDGPEPQGEKRNEDEGRLALGEWPEWTKSLEVIELTEGELRALPEYSCSLPDSYKRPISEGGRPWKRDLNFGGCWPPGNKWVRCEYVTVDDPTKLGIKSQRVVVVPSLQPTSSTQPTEGSASAEGEPEKCPSCSSNEVRSGGSADQPETENDMWCNNCSAAWKRTARVPNIDAQRVEGKELDE